MPALLGQRGRVDEVDVLLGQAEQPVEHGQGQQAGVALGDPPEVVDLDPLDPLRLDQRHRELPQPAAERQERPQHLHVLRRDGRHVDRGGDDAAGERGDDLLGGLDAGAVLGLGRGGAQVRGDHDVVVAVEQRVVGDRLRREDVERGAGHLAGVQRGLQGRVVDELAAGAVDDPHAVAHLGEGLRAEPAARLGRLGQVQGEEVGLGVDVGRRGGLLGAQLAEALGADVGVVGQHAHPERARTGGDELADAPEAQHAERLLVDLDAAEARALPAPGGQRAVRLRDVTGQREHQRHGVLGGGDDVGLRRVGDDDPAPGGGADVDVVDADACAADHLEVVGASRSRRRSAASPSGSGSRGKRRCARPALPRTSRAPGRRRSARAAGRPPSRRSARRRGPGTALRALARCGGGEHAGLEEDALGRAHAGAVVDVVAELVERHLQPRQRGEDVEGAEVAAVRDPQDPALELVLPAVGGDTEASQRARQLGAVDRLTAGRWR